MKKIKLNDIVKVNQSGEWGTGLKEGEIGTKVIRTADFNNDGSINYDNVIFRNIQQKKIDEKKLIYGDIIIEKSGGTDKNPVGRVVFFNDDNNIYLSNNFTQVIKIKESMNSKFVFYNLYCNYKNGSTLQMFNKTTGIQNLQMKQFLNQKISYISLEEQEIAVRKLDNVRNIIEIKQKQLQDLDELIKSQFVEMFGSGNYPREELGKLCDVRDGTHDSPKYLEESGYKFITSKNIINNEIDFSEVKYISKQDYDKFNTRSKVNYGDILMPMIGTIGKPMIVNIPDDEIDFAIKNVALIKFLDNSQVTNIYIKNLLDSDYFENAILQNKRGGTQKFIALSDIRKMQIEIPPIELQNQFADIVKQIDKQKFEIQKNLEEMQKLQESLMNKYFG